MSHRTIALQAGDIELFESGEGEPVLFLHGMSGCFGDDPHIAPLARARHVLMPSHPGFGASSLPDWLDNFGDIAVVYLELLDRLGLASVDVVGCSIGGWIAAEMATMDPSRIRKLVLLAPVGVKLGPADRLDVPDIFALPQDEVNRLFYHDPAKAKFDAAVLPEERLTTMMRNRETLALLTWEPYMHNPKLRHRLQRVTSPTLFLRGASDGFVSDEYLAAYAALIPGSRSEVIAEAGHAAPIEQPDAFAARVLAFIGG